ncbi:helix-turn-helix domain-containing protein [Demequina pelophila]|uniref:helix-turn-helix domain-containing protein n=1 Tax=Demequina pelophila TaxID=1638984 RepID=UPI000782BF60|nr:helix-turn-helix transcriptional regulator [Demequina pelophila]
MTERTSRDPRLIAQGAVLKSWRLERNLKQEQLGLRAGYGSATSPKSAGVAISRIESGKSNPSGPHRSMLLKALGKTEEALEKATEAKVVSNIKGNTALRLLAGEVHVENEVRRMQLEKTAQAMSEQVRLELENVSTVFDRAVVRLVEPFVEAAARVDWPATLPGVGSADHAAVGDTTASRIGTHRAETNSFVKRTLAEGAAGAVAGAGLGAGAAAGLFTAVSAAATASTGTAIAGLSGAAATSATLAWLGGGSLAVGGAGIAGGTIVLGSVAALPVLLATGSVLAFKGRKYREEAAEESERLDQKQAQLQELQRAYAKAYGWEDRQLRAVQDAMALGRELHNTIVEPALTVLAPAAGARIRFASLPKRVQDALALELRLVGLVADLGALPVWLELTTQLSGDDTAARSKTAAKSDDWVEESLSLATIELEQCRGERDRLVSETRA